MSPFAAAVVLAAGRGSRLGGPKARLVVDGRPLLVHHLARFSELGVPQVVVVIHPSEEPRVMVSRSQRVFSEAPDPAGSLACGMSALLVNADDAVLVTPVDSLPPGVEVYRALADALMHGARAAAPVFQGHGGHPLACRYAALAPYAGAGPYPPLRSALHDRSRVLVHDENVVRDLDTPEDVLAATGNLPIFTDRVTY